MDRNVSQSNYRRGTLVSRKEEEHATGVNLAPDWRRPIIAGFGLGWAVEARFRFGTIADVRTDGDGEAKMVLVRFTAEPWADEWFDVAKVKVLEKPNG